MLVLTDDTRVARLRPNQKLDMIRNAVLEELLPGQKLARQLRVQAPRDLRRRLRLLDAAGGKLDEPGADSDKTLSGEMYYRPIHKKGFYGLLNQEFLSVIILKI
jgi:hypothetical protein